MLDKRMEAALNKQVNAELYSAYLYLSMAAQFEEMGLKGFSNWMRSQTMEEEVHAIKLYNYICERGGRVKLDPIEGPKTEWKSPLEAFEDAYAHEQKVSGLIGGLVDLSIELKDHMTSQFLQWFVAEQVEEEASAKEIADKLELMKDAPGGLFMIDKELAARTFIYPPPALAGGE